MKSSRKTYHLSMLHNNSNPFTWIFTTHINQKNVKMDVIIKICVPMNWLSWRTICICGHKMIRQKDAKITNSVTDYNSPTSVVHTENASMTSSKLHGNAGDDIAAKTWTKTLAGMTRHYCAEMHNTNALKSNGIVKYSTTRLIQAEVKTHNTT